jgi:Holliday junction resolvase RusA-like endonuclease
MTDWSFTVPGLPPTVNHAYRIWSAPTGGARMTKTSEAAAYQVGVAVVVRTARPKDWVPARRIYIVYRMWFDTDRRDASNAIKLLEDGIAVALGVNDNTFLPIVASKEVDKANPRVEVTVRNVEP